MRYLMRGCLAAACCLLLGNIAYAEAVGEEFSAGNLKYQVVTESQVDVIGYDVVPVGELVIPSSVEYDGTTYQVRKVADQAFVDCDEITAAEINALEIGDGAFMRCYALEIIELNMDMTRIGNSGFEACRELRDFTYPGCLTEIGENAFSQCLSLTTAYIPSSVETLGDGAYSYCMALKEVAFNHGVKNVPEDAFCGCALLTTIEFGDVETISNRAFAECESLTTVEFGESLKTIGDEAFNECTGLETLSFGSNLESIGDEAFANSRSIYSIESHNPVPPEVGWRAFRRVDKETCKVYVPAGALEAYAGWDDFENILPLGGDAGLDVGDTFVEGDYRYRVLVVDSSVALTGLKNSEEEPEGVLNIPSQVTYNGVTFDITTIGYGAFYYLPGVTEINVPETVKIIESNAFAYNRYAAKINLPEGLEAIGSAAFEGCESVTELTIPSTVTAIYDCAFMSCKGLKEVTVPDAVTEMGVMVFEFCYGLQHITFGSGLATIPVETCSKCSSLQVIDFSPETVAIDHDAFDNCTALVNLVFPEGMERISSWAFGECENIETIEFPSTMTTIEDAAFFDTPALSEIKCYGETPAEVNTDSFLLSNMDAVVYVPESALETYRSMNWGGFTDFRPMEQSGISELTSDSQTTLNGCTLALSNSGKPVTIYDIAGRVIYSGTADGSSIQLNNGVILLLKEGSQVRKFAVVAK